MLPKRQELLKLQRLFFCDDDNLFFQDELLLKKLDED